MPTLTPEEIKFLKTREHDKATLAAGYLSHLDPDVKRAYENLYRRLVDPAYVATMWCDSCALNMVTGVYKALEAENKKV